MAGMPGRLAGSRASVNRAEVSTYRHGAEGSGYRPDMSAKWAEVLSGYRPATSAKWADVSGKRAEVSAAL